MAINGSMRTITLFIFLLAAPLWGDVVHLDDGRTLRGEVKRDGEVYLITAEDGTITSVPRASVKSLELTGNRADATRAASRLASLRRTVGNLDDLQQIIDRYEQFIEQDANAPAIEEAQKDLQTWRQRRDEGLVNFGGKWITPDERDALRRSTIDATRQALERLEAGDDAGAAALIQTALRIEPDHPLALYLQAHLLIGQDKIPEARRVLDQLVRNQPANAPALNNLAYVLWRQNQLPAALLRLDQAMAASPFNQVILDNTAEALNLASESQRNSTVARKTAERFTAQDMRLQAAMSAQGWYRWGGSWIDQATFQRLQERQDTIEQKIAAMEKQYAEIQETIDQIGVDIAGNERSMRQMVANSYFRDTDGRLIQMPLPGLYYQLERDNQRLEHERQLQQQKQQRLRQEAREVKDQLPKPTFSGKLLPIGLSGAPPVDEATTLPASAPVPTSAPATAPIPSLP